MIDSKQAAAPTTLRVKYNWRFQGDAIARALLAGPLSTVDLSRITGVKQLTSKLQVLRDGNVIRLVNKLATGNRGNSAHVYALTEQGRQFLESGGTLNAEPLGPETVAKPRRPRTKSGSGVIAGRPYATGLTGWGGYGSLRNWR